MSTTFSRRAVLAALALAVCVSATNRPAHAQWAVLCVNCTEELTQVPWRIASLEEQITQRITQIKQLEQDIQMVLNMYQNTRNIPRQLWGRIASDLAQINGIIDSASSIAYTNANLDQQFAQKFGTYDGYVAGSVTPGSMAQKYEQWSADTNANVLTTLRAAGLQSSQMNDENSTMDQLQRMSESSGGRMEAIQVGNQMAAQGVKQLQKLRQLMLLDLNMHANWVQQQRDSDALYQAAQKQMATWTSDSVTAGNRY